MITKIKNPWIALSTYEECDEYRFFGRKEDTIKLMSMLEQNDCIVIYAASGDGKSSVINAGLSPEMRRKGFFPLKIIFDTEELNGKNLPVQIDSNKIDFDNLIWRKIRENLDHYQKEFRKKFNLNDDFIIDFISIDNLDKRNIDSDLWEVFRTSVIQDSLGVSDYIPIIIFDQFEEVLRSPWRSEFFAWLETLMKDNSSHKNKTTIKNTHLRKLFKLIFSMRYEYVGELDYWCSQIFFIPQLMQNRYFLKPLSKNQAREIINSAADLDETSSKIAHNADIIIESITSNNQTYDNYEDEVPAIILSLTCHVLFDEWQGNEEFSLSEIGLSDIIYDYYKSITLQIGLSDDQRRVIERVLISANGTRLRIPISDERLKYAGINEFILGENNLVDKHILKCEKSSGENYVEFIHDKLAETILKKREVENLSLNKETKSIRLKNVLVVTLILIMIIGLIWFSKYSISHDKDYHAVNIVEELENYNPINTCVTKLSDVLSDSIDYANAESLSISHSFDSCRSYRECYNNVLNIDGYPLRYAGNAKQLTFPFRKHQERLTFGEKTKKVILLYPELVDSIYTTSRLTEIYVPYNKYEQTLLNPVYQDVTVVRMNPVQTFCEKISYELYREHIHIMGIQMPAWASILFFYAIFGISFIRQRKKYSLNKYFILPLLLTIVAYVLCLEAKLVGWINSINLGIVILVAFGSIILFSYIISNISKRVYNIGNHKYKLSIIYTNKDSRRFAINLKRHFLATGINDKDINLDLLIYKNEYFDLIRFQKALINTRHAIVILDNSIFDTPSFNKLWKAIKSTTCRIHPIILGKIIDFSKLPKVLKKKRGSVAIYPCINIKNYDLEFEIPQLDKAIKSNYSPKQKFIIKLLIIFEIIDLILLFIIV